MKRDLSPERQRSIILNDPYLSKTYEEIYSAMQSAAKQVIGCDAVAIEVGAAGGTLTSSFPTVISSDVRFDQSLDLVLDARSIPIRNNAVDIIFLKDSLHHIPDVESFLSEAFRVLKVGGGIVCVDPYWTGVAKWIYKWFHPEPFNEKQLDWSFQSGDPTFSNQAMLYLLLRRDRKKLERNFSNLEIIEFGPILGPSYVLSGGVTAPRIAPTKALLALSKLENRTNFWRKLFALEFLVVLRKRQY